MARKGTIKVNGEEVLANTVLSAVHADDDWGTTLPTLLAQLLKKTEVKTINGESIIGSGDINVGAGAGHNYYDVVLMEQDALEALTADETREGVLYMGLGEVLSTQGAWTFGGKFPITFGGTAWNFGKQFPVKLG